MIDGVTGPPHWRAAGWTLGRQWWQIDLITGEKKLHLQAIGLNNLTCGGARGDRQLEQVIAILDHIEHPAWRDVAAGLVS